MSITSDIRSYADTVGSEGKKVLDKTQAQLNDVTGQANDYFERYTAGARENVSDIADKANEAVNELRASAEKAINFEAIKSAIEPYLAQVKGYQATVTDRAESLLSTVTNDKFVAKVVEQVQVLVVKPVQSRFGSQPTVNKPATSASKPSPAKATKPAATKPVAKAKPTVRKAAPKRSTKA